MTYPITQQPVKVLSTPTLYDAKYAWKQAAPFDLNLPYTREVSRITYISPEGVSVNPQTVFIPPPSHVLNQVRAIAYDRMVGRISDTADLGEGLFQLRGTASLLFEKLLLVQKTVKRLRRADPIAFRLWMKGELKKRSRSAARINLEVSFVVIPTMSDIYTTVDLLQRASPKTKIYGSAKSSFLAESGPQGQFSAEWTNVVSLFVKYGATISVSNPNLFLASRLGLTNPAVVAWQLLPGSFLVDWFIPVEQFLNQASDFYGLDVHNSFSTQHSRGLYSELWNTYRYSSRAEWATISRETGITLPGLAFRPLRIPSWRRAANAASLAIQAFYK